MSDLDRFELFVYVAQTGSLTQAAKVLQLTKASLSKQIKKLEADLSIDLFSRTGQRLHLTEQGAVLLQQCQRLKDELENTRALCKGFHARPKGQMRIVALEFFARKLIYPRLSQFMQTYPELEISIDISERIPDFEKERVDLAVGFSLAAPDDVTRCRMASTHYVMCASPDYFKRHGKPEHLNDLLQHQYIGHSARNEVRSTHLKPGYKIKIKPKLLFNNVAGMIECAKRGMGIVQLPFYLLEQVLQAGDLVEVLTPFQATDAPVYYFYHKFQYASPQVRCFVDFFLSSSQGSNSKTG